MNKLFNDNFAMFYAMMLSKGLRYKEMPADIETFILSPKYLNLARSCRKKVLSDLKQLFCDPTCFAFCPFEESVLNEAIGSGKSFKTSIMVAYFLHHLLCMKNPQEDFNINDGSAITIMNMSVNATQAKKVVFGEIKSRIDNSPWFLNHKPDPNIRSELRFENNICVLPASSSTTFMLGYNLIVGIMDEAAFFSETATRDVAEEIFYSLKRRVKGRFQEKGLMVMISSPRYIDDFIERKYAEARNEPSIFSVRNAIWEVLEDDIDAIKAGAFFELDGVKIPNRYKSDFTKNPEKAWRDFGAKPSLALEPYLKQWNLIEQCIDDRRINPIDEKGVFADWFLGSPKYKYSMHIDLGIKRDACGIAMGHDEGENIVIDFMHRIKPQEGIDVDIQEVLNMIYGLRQRGFAFAKVSYDQFQSSGSIQELNKRNIKAERVSVEGIEAYDVLKEKFYDNVIRMPRYQPLINELRRLELIKGKKVDHPANSSKDVADAVCGVVYNIMLERPMRRKVKVTF